MTCYQKFGFVSLFFFLFLFDLKSSNAINSSTTLTNTIRSLQLPAVPSYVPDSCIIAASHKLATIKAAHLAHALFAKTRTKVSHAIMLNKAIASNGKKRKGVTNLVINAQFFRIASNFKFRAACNGRGKIFRTSRVVLALAVAPCECAGGPKIVGVSAQYEWGRRGLAWWKKEEI